MSHKKTLLGSARTTELSLWALIPALQLHVGEEVSGACRSLRPQKGRQGRLWAVGPPKLCCRSSSVTGQLPWGRCPLGTQFLPCTESLGAWSWHQRDPKGLKNMEILSLNQDLCSFQTSERILSAFPQGQREEPGNT